MSFLDLHVPGTPLLMPNAWDAGSARLLASLGAAAVATTSSGFAATLGRADGDVSVSEVMAHCAALVAAVGVPVSADLENGAADPAVTFRNAAEVGLAGASIEDWSGTAIYPVGEAAARVATARAAAPGLVLTGRAEGYLHGDPSLSGVLTRLLAYADAGADVLYAPGVRDLAEITTLVAELPRPVNVLLLPGMPSVAQLADAGVSRISVGGQLAWTAWEAAARATREFLAGGSDWLAVATDGRAVSRTVVG